MSGAKTYSRSKECLSEKGNKPSTAKVSVAGIHRWGMTSYTSLRKARLNGERQKEAAAAEEPAKRAKLEEDPYGFEAEPSTRPPAEPAKPRPNKFFKSGSRSAAKNSDFDALRLSVPPSFNSSSKDLFVNIHSKPPPPVFLANDLRYAEPPRYTAPNVHYIRPLPPVEGSAFDALISLDLSATKQDSFREGAFFDAESRKDVLFGASSQESLKDTSYGTSSQESCKDVLFGASSQESCKDVLFGTSSQESLKDTAYGTSSQESCKDVLLGTSSQESPKDTAYGTSSQESCLFGASSDVLFAAPSQKLRKDVLFGSPETCKDGVYSGSSQDQRKDILFGEESGKDVVYSASSQESKKDVFFSSQEPCEDAMFGASSQELSKDEFLAPMDTDSGRLTQDSSQLDFPSSQSSEKSVDSSSVSKQGTRHKKIFSSSSKFKAVYNHRHWHSSKKAEETPEEKGGSLADEFEEEMAKENFHDEPNSSEIAPFKCPKASKEFYTVVKNVKQAYQCHESGETQEFNDDIEYLLECVQECNGIGTRCLSVLNLAAKCMSPAFRIHLRAHGTMPKIFSALQDAPRDPNLSLCTAALMFVLSQDRLTMDIEASTLSLMLQLLEEEEQGVEPEADLILRDPALAAMQDRHRERVGGLCEEMRLKGHAKHLKMDNINTGILAMETLLSLTSRKAGEWFKEEMRTLRGLDRIADTVTSSTESLLPDEQEVVRRPSEAQLDKIRKIDRCLRVLENVTHLNPENQEYLLTYKESLLISSCLQLLRLFKTHLLAQPQGEGGGDVVSCLLNLLKILSNITYGIALDDSMFPPGDGLMDQLLMLILQVPRAVSTEKRFDLLVLSLGLMINLVEYCSSNSAKFIQMHALGSFEGVNDGYEMLATEALVELMFERLECARLSEEQADELLSTQEAKHAERKDAEAAADDLEETLIKTLQKAGKHMEHSIVAAYIIILLGCVSQKHPDFIQVMKDFVPNGNFDVMVDVLKKFKSFVSLTGSMGNRELGSIQKVIHLLESS